MIDRKARRANNKDHRARSFIETNRITRCTKVRYSAAELAWSEVSKMYLAGRNEINVYHCILCKGYHVTSKESAFVSANPSQWKPGQVA